MKTPQVPAMAGMTPLGFKPEKKTLKSATESEKSVERVTASESRAGFTNAEFRERIKGICGIRPANPLVTRTKTDRGYAPPVPTRADSDKALSGEKTIWNSDGTDGPCLICVPPKEAA